MVEYSAFNSLDIFNTSSQAQGTLQKREHEECKGPKVGKGDLQMLSSEYGMATVILNSQNLFYLQWVCIIVALPTIDLDGWKTHRALPFPCKRSSCLYPAT